MKKLTAVFIMALLVPCGAFAVDGVPVLTVLEQTTINGFVDGSYTANMNSGDNTFGFDQGEIDLERMVDDIGIALRVDFEFFNNGARVEQGYMNWQLPFAPAVGVTFGKFNAPIGWELLDPNDMYQYSHSLLFDYCLPTNLTGAMFSIDLTQRINLLAYVANGWDNNADNNSTKTVGGRLGIDLRKFNIGISGIMGVFDDDQLMSRTVIDIDVTYMPMENWIFGGEYNMGTVAIDMPNVDDSAWSGFMVMTHYDFNNWLGLTGRYDSLMDTDMYIFGGPEETRSSFTVAPTFVLGPGLGALIEFRMDMADEDIFLDADNEPVGSQNTVAFEMTYTF
ncbi:porin [bacterium]|nr:porin [bacterium]